MNKRTRIAWHPIQQFYERPLYTEQSEKEWARLRASGLPLHQQIVCKMRWSWLPNWLGRRFPSLTVLILELRVIEATQDT